MFIYTSSAIWHKVLNISYYATKSSLNMLLTLKHSPVRRYNGWTSVHFSSLHIRLNSVQFIYRSADFFCELWRSPLGTSLNSDEFVWIRSWTVELLHQILVNLRSLKTLHWKIFRESRTLNPTKLNLKFTETRITFRVRDWVMVRVRVHSSSLS
jgi:hypothetical protein